MEQHSGVQVSPDPESRSWKEIVSDVVRDIENIFKNEIRLAGTELKTKAKNASKAGAMLGAAGLLGFFAGVCMLVACIAALTLFLPLWLSALIMAVLLGTGAGGAFILGRMALQEIDPVPQRTLETLKDNLEFVKTRTES